MQRMKTIYDPRRHTHIDVDASAYNKHVARNVAKGLPREIAETMATAVFTSSYFYDGDTRGEEHYWVTVDDSEFALANDPPAHKPQQFDNEPTRQRVLVDGMKCLKGQLDLF